MLYRICFIAGMLLFYSALQAQELFINELMSSNVSVVSDEDGEYTDWMEIHNPADSAIQMEGFGLTDDPVTLDKWIFPQLTIAPDGYLLVYCSGKDRFPQNRYYETIIRRGDSWRYRVGDSEPPGDWNSITFDDSGWLTGESGFGYGDDDDNTVIDQALSLYNRKVFTVTDTAGVLSAILNIDFDDAFVAYLNGKEIARSHIGVSGIPPPFDETGELHEARMYRGMDPDQFDIDKTGLVEGPNVLAIQLHNSEWGSSDLTLIPYFTLVFKDPPEIPVGSPPELNFPGSELHTSFRLSSGGEMLILTDSSGNLMDSVSFGAIPRDISYGRQSGDPGKWLYFEDPTPGAPNGATGIENITEGEVAFSPSVKFFEGSISVSLSGNQAEGMIRYTKDGSEPDENDTEFSTSIDLNTTTIIRARIFRDGQLPGKTYSYNYIDRDDIDADNIPVISISTDPDNLYNRSDGLFENAENRELEKPVHVEFIESDGIVGFSIDAGLKIFGNEPSGGDHQHKLAIFARSKYGYGSIDYHLFPDKPIKKFESVVLRNGIPEIWDVIASRLIDEEAVSKQSYRPAIVFINGEYWGTKFIREKINEHFVASNFGVDPDSVDVIMGIESPVEYYNEDWPIAGDLEDYKDLIHYLIDHDLSDSANYEYIRTRIDIHNYITYQASEIYYGNIDWPGNNMKWWRERNDNGIWRWILFDVDAGMGAWEGYSYNSMLHATEPDGPEQWPNPPWSTFVFRKLLENQSFRDQFVQRSMDLLNTDFTREKVHKEIAILVRETEGEIRNHSRRWEGSYREWEDQVEDLRYWSKYRATRVRIHIKNYFDLGTIQTLNLNCIPSGGGQIRINSKLIERFPWEGRYIEDLPLSLEAIPAYGYRFTGWDGTEGSDRSVSVQLDQSRELTALFDPEDWYSPMVINEINYHSSPDFNAEDWIELYNNGSESVDLTNWVLKDSDDMHAFIFPSSQIMEPGAYLVVSKKRSLFSNAHPGVSNYTGDLGFGLSGGGEIVRLFNHNQELIDWVEYDDFTPWPLEADGKGATLALDHPDLDNSEGRNWVPSFSGGTPGSENIILTSSEIYQSGLGFQVMDPWPNPFRNLTHITYRVEEPGRIHMAVYDLQGRILDVLVDEHTLPGEYTASWNGVKRAPGVYICVIRSDAHSITKKLILTGRY